MRIIVTGAGGMVGRNLLEHAGKKKYEIFAPLRGELDLFDFSAVKEYLSRVKPDMIIHPAGKVGGIQANMRKPVDFLMENMDMGRNLVWAANVCGVQKLLNLGSSCMYPRNAANPLKEEMVLQGELEPTNEGYALAKTVIAKLCSYISRENPDRHYKTLIPCNLYGRWDKFSPDQSHMIPAVIRKLHLAKINEDKTVEIWGDGTARREFMYAGDIADCICRSIGEFDSLPDIMNVGLGEDYSVNEYYRVVADVVGYRGDFTHDLAKPAGMERKLVDTSRMVAWGWKPSTSLKAGIVATYEFYLANHGDKQ